MENQEGNGNVVLRSGRQLGATGNQPPNTSGSRPNISQATNANETTPSHPNVNANAGTNSTINIQNVDGLSDGSVRSKGPNANVNHSEPQNDQVEVEEEDTNEFQDASAVHEWAGGEQGNSEADLAGMVREIRESLSQLEIVAKKDKNPKEHSASSQDLTVQPRTRTPAQSIRDEIMVTQSRSNLKPPRYDGTSSWSDYLLQFKLISRLNGWDEEQKLCHLGGSLDGVAREVLGDNELNMGDSFDALVQCLEDRFGPSKKEELFKTLLWNKVQKPDEDFPDLAYNIRRMVKNTYPRSGYETISEMSRDHFIRALRDPNMRDMIYFKEPETLDEAVHVAIKLAARENRFEQKPSKAAVT